MVLDLSKLSATSPDNLLPLERRTVILGGKAYMWTRDTTHGPLTLSPGYVPGDPFGCDMTEPVGPLQFSWPRVCVLHRNHAGQHRHKPTLDTPAEPWGPDRPARNRTAST